MYFTDCVVNTFLWDVFLKLCVCIRCKLRREVPFKLIFIRYNMEPRGFLVFFLTLRARGMRRRWRRRRTRRSPPSLLFTWLLTSLLSSSRWRTRLGRRGCATSFLEIFAPFWTRISLDNSLLYFWTMRAILLLSWSLFSHCTFHINIVALSILYLRSVRASKVERGGWGSGLHFYIAMTLGEYNIRSKQRFYEIKFIFYRINSFATFEQPYFCCKTKLKIKFIFYRMSLFYKQNYFFTEWIFLTELNFMKGNTDNCFK